MRPLGMASFGLVLPWQKAAFPAGKTSSDLVKVKGRRRRQNARKLPSHYIKLLQVVCECVWAPLLFSEKRPSFRTPVAKKGTKQAFLFKTEISRVPILDFWLCLTNAPIFRERSRENFDVD